MSSIGPNEQSNNNNDTLANIFHNYVHLNFMPLRTTACMATQNNQNVLAQLMRSLAGDTTVSYSTQALKKKILHSLPLFSHFHPGLLELILEQPREQQIQQIGALLARNQLIALSDLMKDELSTILLTKNWVDLGNEYESIAEFVYCNSAIYPQLSHQERVMLCEAYAGIAAKVLTNSVASLSNDELCRIGKKHPVLAENVYTLLLERVRMQPDRARFILNNYLVELGQANLKVARAICNHHELHPLMDPEGWIELGQAHIEIAELLIAQNRNSVPHLLVDMMPLAKAHPQIAARLINNFRDYLAPQDWLALALAHEFVAKTLLADERLAGFVTSDDIVPLCHAHRFVLEQNLTNPLFYHLMQPKDWIALGKKYVHVAKIAMKEEQIYLNLGAAGWMELATEHAAIAEMLLVTPHFRRLLTSDELLALAKRHPAVAFNHKEQFESVPIHPQVWGELRTILMWFESLKECVQVSFDATQVSYNQTFQLAAFIAANGIQSPYRYDNGESKDKKHRYAP